VVDNEAQSEDEGELPTISDVIEVSVRSLRIVGLSFPYVLY